jgi:hypothetical protein
VREGGGMSHLTILNTEIRADEHGRYCLNDLHRAAGSVVRHRPGQWTRTAPFKELVSELRKDASMHLDPVGSVHGGADRGTYVCRELVIAYAMWVSPAFMLQVIRAFDGAQQQAMHEAAVQHQQLAQLVLGFQAGKSEASLCGKVLGKWGKRRRTMMQRIEHLERQLQLTLDLSASAGSMGALQ